MCSSLSIHTHTNTHMQDLRQGAETLHNAFNSRKHFHAVQILRIMDWVGHKGFGHCMIGNTKNPGHCLGCKGDFHCCCSLEVQVAIFPVISQSSHCKEQMPKTEMMFLFACYLVASSTGNGDRVDILSRIICTIYPIRSYSI